MTGPLAGLRVIELCDELGQYAGKLLADMGADVVKVEPPGGSSARAVGPFVKDVPGPNRSLNFWYHNTNKRSCVVDLEDGVGRETFRRVVAGADVVLEDRAPGWLAGRGIGYETLAREALVWCAITPFGQDGPWAGYASSDLVGLALGGPMMMNGYSPEDAPGAPPIHGNGDQGYKTTCHYASHGVLVALIARQTSSRGQYIDCSMHEALSCTVEVGMPYWLYARRDVVRQTARHAAAQRTEPWLYPARDGRDVLLFGVGRDNASWAKIKEWFRADGFGTEFDDPRFDDPRARQPGGGSPVAAEMMAEMKRFIAAHDADDVYRGGQERDQAWGTVRAPDETVGDPHLHDRGFFVGVAGEGVEQPAMMPGAPYMFSATPWELRRPAPKLGEHTAEILAEVQRLAPGRR